jgi:hypothetical protein
MSTGTLYNATAIGGCAQVAASNALVLGTVSGACGSDSGFPSANINVGIDDSNPSSILTLLQGGGPAIADGWNTTAHAAGRPTFIR